MEASVAEREKRKRAGTESKLPAELTQARLWLVESARIGLAIGLRLLGVSAPESM